MQAKRALRAVNTGQSGESAITLSFWKSGDLFQQQTPPLTGCMTLDKFFNYLSSSYLIHKVSTLHHYGN